MKRALLFIITVTFILLSFDIAVFSRDVPDPGRLGSIGITMRYGGKNVPGGSMTIYRIGDVIADNGNYSFMFSGDFTGVDAELEDLGSSQLIYTVAAYIADNDIKGTDKAIDNNGNVKFYDLEPGLYMLIQDTSAVGYNCSNPFLVSLPMYTDGEYIYDIDASAKAELTKNSDTTYEGTNTGGKPTTRPSGDKLPQTGQLKWPIPILTVSGACLVLVGMILCFSGRWTEDEN